MCFETLARGTRNTSFGFSVKGLKTRAARVFSIQVSWGAMGLCLHRSGFSLALVEFFDFIHFDHI